LNNRHFDLTPYGGILPYETAGVNYFVHLKEAVMVKGSCAIVAAGAMLWLAGVPAFADSPDFGRWPPPPPHHNAPAPLLAAGLPALVVLGGVAGVAGLARRRRKPHG